MIRTVKEEAKNKEEKEMTKSEKLMELYGKAKGTESTKDENLKLLNLKEFMKLYDAMNALDSFGLLNEEERESLLSVTEDAWLMDEEIEELEKPFIEF